MAKSKPKYTFNIMNHQLVPLHEILSDDEKEKVLESLKITPDQLPKILNSDPVCLSIDAKSGQVLRITRKSHTAKEAVAYRLVVESD